MKKLIVILVMACCSVFAFAQATVDEALAYQYFQQGDFEKAATLFEKLFNQTKNDNYFDLYFTSLIKVKKYTQAEAVLKKLAKQFPEKSAYKVALGRVYQENGRTAEANKVYMEAIDNTPKDENKYRELANNFYRFEAYDMAIAAFLQGRKALGEENLFIYELLGIYRFKKDKVNLIQEYINALATTPQLLAQAQGMLSSLFEDKKDYQLLQTALLKKIQKDPQMEIYTDFLVWGYIQQEEYEMALRQLIAQDKRTKGDGLNLFANTSAFVANKAYPTAVKAYEYLVSKGKETDVYVQSKIELVNTKYEIALMGKSDPAALAALATEYQEILDEFGRVGHGLRALRKLANLQAYYLKDLNKAEKTLEDGIKLPGISQMDAASLKMDLGDIYILTKQPWEAILVYEQVAKQYENQPIGNDAKFRSARLSFYQGNFQFAKAQADVLKASTSQLIANDALNLSLLISDNLQNEKDSLALQQYADAEMLQFMNRPDEAILKLDSIAIRYPNNSLVDDVLMAKAKIFVKTKNVDAAVSALKTIIDTHNDSIWIDDALFMLADLYEKTLNQSEEAKKLFQRLMNEYPGSMFNAEARKRFRNIRGDNLP